MVEKLQPIKHEAQVPTQAHTLAIIGKDETGRVGIYLECFRPRCNCSRFVTLDELVKIMGSLEGEGVAA